MIRMMIATLVVFLGVNAAQAEEIRGILKKVDVAKGTITVEFPGAPGEEVVPDREFAVTKVTRIVDLGGKDVLDRLKAKFFEKAGGKLTVTITKENGKEIVTKVKVAVEP
jgi:hypothetical protein